MFSSIKLTHFTKFTSLDWQNHAAMNVIIGENDTGKSHLLKLLYAIGRSINMFHKSQGGPSPEDWVTCFVKKQNWTFGIGRLSLQSLIQKGSERLEIEASIGYGKILYLLSNTDNLIEDFKFASNHLNAIGHTIFFPPNEILTAIPAIELIRKRFDVIMAEDPHMDLIEDFRAPLTYGEIEPELATIPNKIKNLLYEGEIVEKGTEFVFKRGNEEYSIAQTAEGFKKIGIISRLILNRSITKGSILLVDEPESNLHPKAIIAMADILFDLSQAGVQVYAATHSYFFIKRIEQLARRNDKYVCLADLRRSPDGVKATFHDLRNEIPDNPILDQSAYLLNEDIRLDWGQ